MNRPIAALAALLFLASCNGGGLPGASRSLPEVAPGEVWAEYAEGHLSLVANEAPRLDILKKLGATAKIAAASGRLEAKKLSLRIADATLEQAVAEIAAGEPYWLSYAVDAGGQGHRLRSAAVGLGGDRRMFRTELRERMKKKRAERDKQRELAPAEAPSSPDEPPSSPPTEEPPAPADG